MAEFLKEAAHGGFAEHAPTGEEFTAYDAAQMLTYARLLDAERAGQGWRDAAREILLLDVAADPAAAELCWRLHLARAQWTISAAGLAAAAASELWESQPRTERR
jgi:hypothetical protein